jgi:site-specific DNA-methyltransferase (adenine-specific)
MPIKKEVTIGDCRLILGDCTKIVEGLNYDAIVSDPPFGMAFQSNHRRADTTHKAIANDENVELLQWITNLPASHSKYIFCRWDNLTDVVKPKSVITWIKDNHSMGDLKHEHGRQTELCLFYAGDDHFFPSKRPNDVLKCARTGNNLHPTEKPVPLMQEIIKWTSGVVLDPFAGSFSTLVACAKMGRKGIGIELDPDYFEIACKRVEEAYKSPDMFVEAAKEKPVQEGFEV